MVTPMAQMSDEREARSTSDHFRRQVFDRADGSDAGDRLTGVDHLGEAQVGEMATAVGQQDVRGLDVSVSDAGLVEHMGCTSGVGDGPPHLAAVEGASRLTERAVGTVDRCVEEPPVLVTGVENRKQVRRGERRIHPELVGHPCEVGIGGALRQGLDRHVLTGRAAESGRGQCQPEFAMVAGAQVLHEGVVGDATLPRCLTHIRIGCLHRRSSR